MFLGFSGDGWWWGRKGGGRRRSVWNMKPTFCNVMWLLLGNSRARVLDIVLYSIYELYQLSQRGFSPMCGSVIDGNVPDGVLLAPPPPPATPPKLGARGRRGEASTKHLCTSVFGKSRVRINLSLSLHARQRRRERTRLRRRRRTKIRRRFDTKHKPYTV